MLPASSRLRLHTSLPLSGRWPRGTSERGMSTKTLRSSKLFSSSRAPAIQYSRSAEASAEDQEGLSLSSRMVSVSPADRAARTLLTEEEGGTERVTGTRQCVSRTGANSFKKADSGVLSSKVNMERSGGGVWTGELVELACIAARRGERRKGSIGGNGREGVCKCVEVVGGGEVGVIVIKGVG